MWGVRVGILCCLVAVVYSQSSAQPSVCHKQLSCGSCIAAHEMCGWCNKEGFDENNIPRCDFYENLIQAGCEPQYREFPDHSDDYLQDDPLKGGGGAGAVQIKPQRIKLKLRPNKPYKLKVEFRQAEDYPVDLYYIMDLSRSMKDDKDSLAKLGGIIGEKMNKITKDFRLGFGSFVDKLTMPYVSTVRQKLIEPCDGCTSPYGFKHHLQLDKNTVQFTTHVNNAQISGNLDSPEGGFDALMQAVMCQEMGWREQSRRMILFSTDAASHFAGDGKLGGIVTPNDGACHLNAEGYYTKTLDQDYPSISQLAAKISEKKVNVIFAVTEDQHLTYEKLTQYIEGSTAGILANDSSNIVNLIQENYNKITSKVELNTQNAENISVTFHSKCLNPNGELEERSSCEGLKVAHNVSFDVSIEIKTCPKDPAKRKRTFSIYPVGLEDKLTIEVEMLCECECEKPQNEVPNSPKCHGGMGTYECGVCTCNAGRYGRFCECDGSEVSTNESDAKCMKKGSEPLICMGRGECVCGVCQCFTKKAKKEEIQRYDGPFCECDNFQCSYSNGFICGGPSHGTCDCGKCVCEKGYGGHSCDCPTSNDACLAANGKMCNGEGACGCFDGKKRCKCFDGKKYRGPKCEECATCAGARCSENKNCVQCKAFKSGEFSEEECEKECTKPIEIVSEVKAENENITLCQFIDKKDDCTFYFSYEYLKGDNLRIKAQRTKACPEPVNVLAIVLGVIGGIVFLGLALLLIWKILTTIQDRREIAKFEKEKTMAKWDTTGNPIYQQATSTHINPTYGAGK